MFFVLPLVRILMEEPEAIGQHRDNFEALFLFLLCILAGGVGTGPDQRPETGQQRTCFPPRTP
jgi:hypothetical protein